MSPLAPESIRLPPSRKLQQSQPARANPLHPPPRRSTRTFTDLREILSPGAVKTNSSSTGVVLGPQTSTCAISADMRLSICTTKVRDWRFAPLLMACFASPASISCELDMTPARYLCTLHWRLQISLSCFSSRFESKMRAFPEELKPSGGANWYLTSEVLGCVRQRKGQVRANWIIGTVWATSRSKSCLLSRLFKTHVNEDVQEWVAPPVYPYEEVARVGSSIGVKDSRDSGTLGAYLRLEKLNQNGRLVAAVTCNHVAFFKDVQEHPGKPHLWFHRKPR